MSHHSNYEPTPQEVLEFQALTNMPLLKCKKALLIGNGNKKLAYEWIRVAGLAIYRNSPLTTEELAQEAKRRGFNPEYADRNDLVWMAKYG